MNEGKTIGHYNILRPLGKGGMGEVYLAEDTRLKREVAVKVLPESVRSDSDRLKRFRREAEAAAKLKHPNIATIHVLEEVDDHFFIKPMCYKIARTTMPPAL
jgi:serine/threonine protein kinase